MAALTTKLEAAVEESQEAKRSVGRLQGALAHSMRVDQLHMLRQELLIALHRVDSSLALGQPGAQGQQPASSVTAKSKIEAQGAETDMLIGEEEDGLKQSQALARVRNAGTSVCKGAVKRKGQCGVSDARTKGMKKGVTRATEAGDSGMLRQRNGVTDADADSRRPHLGAKSRSTSDFIPADSQQSADVPVMPAQVLAHCRL